MHLSSEGRVNCRSLGFPGFPVELGGFGELYAPFLTERRTRVLVLCCVAGNPGSLGMTKGRVALPSGVMVAIATPQTLFHSRLNLPPASQIAPNDTGRGL